MNKIWDANNVEINGVTQNRFDGMQMFTQGTGAKFHEPTTDPSFWSSFGWEATVTNRGWYVAIFNSNGSRKGEYQGLTYNLPLEVATAAMRLL